MKVTWRDHFPFAILFGTQLAGFILYLLGIVTPDWAAYLVFLLGILWCWIVAIKALKSQMKSETKYVEAMLENQRITSVADGLSREVDKRKPNG